MVDIRKNLTVRKQFVQVATEHPRASLNGMSWNPAISNQAIPSGSHHLVIGDSLVGDLIDLCQRADYCPIFWGRFRGSSHQDDGDPGRGSPRHLGDNARD